jgi:hypothetical protein
MVKYTSPWPWSQGDIIIAGDNTVDGYSVHDADGNETGCAVPPDGLDNWQGRANGILVLACGELFQLVRRFASGCSATGSKALNSQLLHAWTDANRLLAEMEADLCEGLPPPDAEGGAA